MTRYAKVNKDSGIVESVADYDRTPQVSDHERASAEFVELNDGAQVEPGHPLPAEARKGGQQPSGRPGGG